MTAKKDFLQKWMRVDALEKISTTSAKAAKRSSAPADRSLAQRAPGASPESMRAPAPAAPPAPPIGELAPPPALVPFADMDFWYLSNDMVWTLPRNSGSVRVPKGFVTDFATIPSTFWSWMPPTGRYGLPAIVHDWLYWDQSVARSQADAIFEAALSDLAVSSFRRFIIYRSVRWFGGKYWRENTQAKAAGAGRVLRAFPNDARITWSDWSKKPGVFA